MTFGWIDPARLEGDALRRWYLRSPADIEEARRRTADQQHDRFFSGLRPAQIRGDAGEAARVEPMLHGGGAASHGTDPAGRGSEQPGTVALAAAEKSTAPRVPLDCLSCHGRAPPFGPIPLPPPLGRWQLRPGVLPSFFRDMPGGAPPPPRREERKQCEMQEQRDVGTCSQQPTEAAKAECYSNIPKRRYHCDQTGEIGIPDLFTARRRSGRRWP